MSNKTHYIPLSFLINKTLMDNKVWLLAKFKGRKYRWLQFENGFGKTYFTTLTEEECWQMDKETILAIANEALRKLAF